MLRWSLQPGWRNWYTQWIQNPPPHGLRVRVSLPAQNKRARRDRENAQESLRIIRDRASPNNRQRRSERLTGPLPAPIQIFHCNSIVPRIVTLYHNHIWVQTVRPTKASSKVVMLRLEKPRARKKSDLKPDARRGKPRTRRYAYGGKNLRNRFRKWERI